MEAAEAVARRMVATLRPRVSLASGSVMVLLTLILPIGYESCGPETKGYELLQGRGGWPTFLGIFGGKFFGSPFYGLLLALAFLTILLVLISLLKPALWRNRAFARQGFLCTAGLSLFLLADVAALLPAGAEEWGAAAAALLVASCLSPVAFWPRRLLERWLGPLVLSMLAIWVSTRTNLAHGEISAWCMVGIWMIYALAPLGIWLAYAAGRFGDCRPAIRRGLIAFYIPAVLGNIGFFFVAWREGLWGFVPCSLGLFLMALGYARLSEEAEPNALSLTPGPA
jgi:hypothetical protein